MSEEKARVMSAPDARTVIATAITPSGVKPFVFLDEADKALAALLAAGFAVVKRLPGNRSGQPSVCYDSNRLTSRHGRRRVVNHLRDLKPDKRNTRKHNPRNLGQIERSIQANGFGRSILLANDGTIIAGNATYDASAAAGLEDVLIVESDGTRVIAVKRTDVEPGSKQFHELAIADNRSAELADWDPDILRELQEQGEIDLSQFWFDDELDVLLASMDAPVALTDPDDVPPVPEEPVTKPGDLWCLGRHKLLCGDATVVTDVEWLMDGEKADMVFTDPPYGMDLDTDYAKIDGSRKFKAKGNTYRPVEGDGSQFDPSALIVILGDVDQFWWGGDWYYENLPRGGSWIVWDKRHESSDEIIGNHFEMLWSKNRHRRRIIRHLWAGITARNDDTKRVHPTEKPVAVLILGVKAIDRSPNSGACANASAVCSNPGLHNP